MSDSFSIIHKSTDLDTHTESNVKNTAIGSSKPNFSPLDCSKNFLDLLSTHFLICNEKIEGNGEDSGFEAYTCESGIIGAFDGCGGLGSKICPAVSQKTEAYLASRAVGGAVREWFYSNSSSEYTRSEEELKKMIVSNLSVCQKHSGESGLKLKGSLVRPFPSTIAMVTFKIAESELITEHIWAGDSRTYLLDNQGLAQISIDDIKGEDAMSNLTKDGALTNVLSADNHFVLHKTVFVPKKPCIIFCATDGCFGYVSSPMEFEFMILSSLVNAKNTDDWQHKLSEDIFERSGDDQTIAVAAFGFESFEDLKNYYTERCNEVYRIIQEFEQADADRKQSLWEEYKPGYYRYTAN